MLVLLGPLLSVLAASVASAGAPLELVHDAGMLAFAAIGASFVVTFAIAAVVFMASRRAPGAAAFATPLALVPWAIMALAVLMGAALVASAVSGVDLAAQPMIAARGSAEIMASRTLGAAMVFGSALSLCPALLVLSRSRDGGEPQVAGSALAALVLLGLAVVALVIVVDATVLRRGLYAASEADLATRGAVLGATLDEARTTYLALLAVVGLTTFLGFALVVLAEQRGSNGGALLVGTTWLLGALSGGADIAMLHQLAATLALPTPWASEPNFEPLRLEGRAPATGSVACLATLTRVRCHAGDAGYDALDSVLPRPEDAGTDPNASLAPGVTLAGVPTLTMVLDARLPAPALRKLLLAAVRAGYRSLTVVSAWTPEAFGEGEVPPLLRSQAETTSASVWLVALAVREGGDGMAPVAIEVRDDDTTDSLARRAHEVVDQSVLVLPTPLPPIAASRPPTDADGVGLLGSPAAEAAPSTLDASAISRVVRSNVAAVRACYEHGLRTDPGLAGRTEVHFTITPAGTVSDVTASSTLSAPAVLRCIEAAVASMTFPADAAREPISISYPFVFNASP